MRDHRDFLTALPADRKTALTETSDRAGLRHLAGHAGLILIVGALIAARVPLWPLLLPVQGVLIVFLFTLEHECTHRTPFRSQALSDWVGRACGLAILLPFEWFRYFHLAHHRFTNIPGKDPELDSAKPATPGEWLAHVSGLPLWWGNLRLILRLVAGRERAACLPERALPRMEREARIMLALYALAALSLLWSQVLFWVWLLPMLIGQPFPALPSGRTRRLPAGREHVRKHPHDLYHIGGPVPRCAEHALSRRTSRLSRRPSTACPTCTD